MTDLLNIANNGKLLSRFTKETVALIAKVNTRKHQNACMVLLHSAEYGECSHMNLFYQALNVNDANAFRQWVALWSTYLSEDDTDKHFITFTNKKDDKGNTIGFRVAKGTEKQRKGLLVLDELLAADPFYTKDVGASKNWDLNALLETLIKAAETVEKKSEKENIDVPLNIRAMVAELKVSAAKAIVPAANANVEKVVSNVA